MYDPALIGPLTNMLDFVLGLTPPPIIWMASTVRNPETYKGFISSFGNKNISSQEVPIYAPPNTEGLVYADSLDGLDRVLLLRLSRKTP